nr:MAG TPA: hypothetical protein [Caudoviricetes sp.]
MIFYIKFYLFSIFSFLCKVFFLFFIAINFFSC